ncbi:murein biosynthesis integral membrane protein MurJ [Pelagibacterium sp.]|uniref:murein biosynthesis integral membrane protein MurJ n=1 Tax=Pelagibacterium sp. TaxID=1967288 RepID=UPI003BAAB590
MSLFRNTMSVGGLTLLSRIFGFVRDALIAAVLGIGPAADAFQAAFRLPNLFRRLFAEGAFNTAFVPMFSGALETDGADAAKKLAGRIMSWLVAAILIVTILAEIFMEPIMTVFVPGFVGDPEKFALTVFLSRIMFPYLACMSLMAAYGAILNSLGKFFAAAFAPVLLNLVNIAVLVPLAIWTLENPADVAFWLGVAAMAGGIAQLALVFFTIRRAGFLPAIGMPRYTDEVRRFWLLALPAIAAGGIIQINVFVGTVIASQADAAIAIIANADRLYQLPLGIIGIAIGTVLLPELSRHLSSGREVEARASQSQALQLSMVLTLPAAVALFVLAEPIVRVLFERGAFDAAATVAVSHTLMGFSLGLPAFVLVRVLQPGFFSRKDTKTPTLIAGVSLIVNIAVSLTLFPHLEHIGIALATATSAWVNVGLLVLFLARRGHFRLEGREGMALSGTLGVAIAMGLALWALSLFAAPAFAPGFFFPLQTLALLMICALGAVLYFTLLHISGVQPLGAVLARLRRRR